MMADPGQAATTLRQLTLAQDSGRILELLTEEVLELLLTAPSPWIAEALAILPPAAALTPAVRSWQTILLLGEGSLPAFPPEEKLLELPAATPAWTLVHELLRASAGLASSTPTPPDGPTALTQLLKRWHPAALGGVPASSAASASPDAGAAAPAHPVFAVNLLGPPQICRMVAGEPIELRFPLRRALQVIAFLALSPGFRAPRDELIAALWADASEETVRKNFHPTLSLARRILLQDAGPDGPAKAPHPRVEPIVCRQRFCSLSPDCSWQVDVARFEQAVTAGSELAGGNPADAEPAFAPWLSAWRLYRGPLLTDCDDDWVQGPREQLHRRYLFLLRAIGDLRVTLGQDESALDAYRALLLEDPFAEAVHQAVMQVYGRQGRRDLVRRQYVRLQEMLKELAVEPLQETQDLYHQLMR